MEFLNGILSQGHKLESSQTRVLRLVFSPHFSGPQNAIYK